MKLNFALNLTDDRIALLHRVGAGWAELGAADFGAHDMEARLAAALDAAKALSPKGVLTKVVIPNSQILFTTLDIAPGPVEARRDDIREALAGRTPYAVDELVFDFMGDGAQVQVAVVAQETLDQAEAFAVEHGFGPMAFVGIPPEGDFPGEPYFGPSKAASSMPRKGRKVERDAGPIVVLPAELPAELPVAVMAAEAFPEAEEPAHASEAFVAPEPVVTAVAAAPEPEPEPEPEAEPQPQEVAAPPVEAMAKPVHEVAPEQTTQAEPEPMAAPAFTARRFGGVVDPRVPDVDEAPFAEVPDSDAQDTSAASDDLPPAPSTAALMAFASRRAAANAGTTTVPPRPMGETTMPGLVAERMAARAQGNVRPEPRVTVGSAVTMPPAGKKQRKPEPAARTVPPVVAASVAATDTPRKPLTKPGGTFGSAAPTRGKPRFLGLILTGILILFLALLAAWSSFFLASQSDPDTQPATDVAVQDTPAIADEALADGQVPEDISVGAPPVDVAAVPEAAIDAGPEPASDTMAPVADIAEPETAGPAPETGVVTTGPVPVAPDAEADEILLSTADTPLTDQQAATLAAPDLQADAVPVPQMAPPPFGTEYTFNPNGTIQAVPEGIMTPDGVRLVAGEPANVPPARPAAIAAAAATVVAEPAVEPPAPDETTAVGADPALADARPRPRPASLVVPNAEDDAALPTDGPILASSPRPLPRPAAIVAANTATVRESDAASLAAASAAAGSAAEAIIQDLAVVDPAITPSGSRLAVSVSRIPAPRPRDMERAVAAALEAATRAPAPEPEPEPEQVAAATPEQEPEPEVEAPVAAAPTSGSVADQATFVNALNLSRINLIGVYGTQSSRYALIRQSNGRYKRVEVGDRIDGGVVQAITSNEVRYQKGGRLIALQMPQG